MDGVKGGEKKRQPATFFLFLLLLVLLLPLSLQPRSCASTHKLSTHHGINYAWSGGSAAAEEGKRRRRRAI
eukprot:2768658-Rhodomonas_salina.1